MKLYDDKLLVITGGAGFIGSGVVQHLNERGVSKNIVIVDELGSGDKWRNLVGKQYCEFVHKEDLFSWLEGKESEIAAFIHLGACSDTQEKDADYLIQNNYRYSVRLAEYALTNSHRFIYASSAATYGDGSLGFSDAHDVIEELRPLNMYGYSKQMFDLWIKNQGALNSVVGLKYFNVFGPNEGHKGKMASAIAKMVPDAAKTGAIRLFKSNDPQSFGDGEQRRDFIYVKDAVRMTCAFLEKEVNGIFNIGSGKASTWNQLGKAVIRGVGLDSVRIEYIDMPMSLSAQYQNYTKADMSKFVCHMGAAEGMTRSLMDTVVEYTQDYLLKGKRW